MFCLVLRCLFPGTGTIVWFFGCLGRVLIFSDTSIVEKIVAHGANPDLGSMENMHSHRLEAYAVLFVFVFLSEYANYFGLSFNNSCTLYCDNKEIVKKVQKLTKTNNEFKPYYKLSEHETIIAIQYYLPQKIQVIHLYSHQDTMKSKDNLTFPEKIKWPSR